MEGIVRGTEVRPGRGGMKTERKRKQISEYARASPHLSMYPQIIKGKERHLRKSELDNLTHVRRLWGAFIHSGKFVAWASSNLLQGEAGR